ncbi:universal stress protein [Kitasatospora sp. GP82]|uniref:universal stress protein n=1 Tax=Kitasatospora sp. GP82 TaxID=3035089 RepID=UPI002474AC12|nr:universal stress protein [Kitasatospora sp. GP82]MDH6125831.1 nucleotide-binding universal stress UspA family protein [Kitasatospora sp. GP82]
MSDGARVIVGVSGSLNSLTALHRAVDEARARRAVLVPVLAWTPVGGERNYRAQPCPPLLRAWEEAADERLERAFRDAFGGFPVGVRVEPLVVRGETGPMLTRIADRPNDLLVVSTGRQGGLRRLLHGSVSRYCLAHATCPVVAVPPSTLHSDLRRVAHIVDLRELSHAA